MIYTLVEFPAHRIALAYRSLNGKHKKGRLAVITVQVFIASILLPIFIANWLLVVTWNIMYTVFYNFLTFPRVKWKKYQTTTERQVEEYKKFEYEAVEKREDQEVAKAQEVAKEDTRKDADRATIQEDKEDKKKQVPRKTSSDGFQKKLRQDREKEEQQLKKYVALLIPKQLYESRDGVISRRKERVRMPSSNEENDVESLRGSHEGDHASAGPFTPPQAQASIISKIMSFFRHQNDTAVASKEAV